MNLPSIISSPHLLFVVHPVSKKWRNGRCTAIYEGVWHHCPVNFHWFKKLNSFQSVQNVNNNIKFNFSFLQHILIKFPIDIIMLSNFQNFPLYGFAYIDHCWFGVYNTNVSLNCNINVKFPDTTVCPHLIIVTLENCKCDPSFNCYKC